MRILQGLLLGAITGTSMALEAAWVKRSLEVLYTVLPVMPMMKPDAHCLQFPNDAETTVELHRISENGWKDMDETAYIQQSFLLTNNGERP